MGPGDRAVAFGRSVDAYDKARPSYPVEACEHILALTEVERAVEVGAGTGKATVGLAAAGRSIICLEPDPAMARALISRKLPGVEVVISRIEEWEGPPQPVDLVYAAQAWHWVDPDPGYRRAMEMLRPGGALALMWNTPIDRYGAFADVYRSHAPHLLAEQDDRVRRRDSDTWLEELRAFGFDDVELFVHRWEATLSAAHTRLLYSTYSDHIMLDPALRRRLLDAVEERVEALGGAVVQPYRTQVFSGRAPLSSPSS